MSQQTKSSNPKDILAAEEQRVLLHLIPSTGLIHTALAMMDGARKYGPYNWREEGVGAGTYVSAAMRHIRDWLDGEETAPDSEIHHLGHAAACLMILMDVQAIGNLVDDRPEPAPTSEMMEEVKATGRVGGEEQESPEMPDVVAAFCHTCNWEGYFDVGQYIGGVLCPECGAIPVVDKRDDEQVAEAVRAQWRK